MSVCPFCEAENDPVAARCERCGEPLARAQAPAEESAPTEPVTRRIEEAEPPTRPIEPEEPPTRPLEPAAAAPDPVPQPENASQGSHEPPPQGTHQGPPTPHFGPPAPPQPGRPQILVAGDVVSNALDGLLALAAGLLLALLAALAVVSLVSSTARGGFGSYVTLTVMLVGGALGVPGRMALHNQVFGVEGTNGSGSGGGLTGLSFSSTTAAWGVAVILMALILGTVFRRARRRERTAPSASVRQLAARSAVPAVAVSLALLVLALLTQASSLFGYPVVSGADVHDTIGLEPGWTLLGPMLLIGTAAVLGRLAAWLPRQSALPGLDRARAALPGWAPAWHAFWLQLRVVTVLCGLGVWVYTAISTLNDAGDSGRAQAGLILGSALLIPNYGLTGMLVGFGATFGTGFSGLTQAFTGLGPGFAAGRGAGAVGLFAPDRPWGLWLLLLAALISAAAPAGLARSGPPKEAPERFVPSGTWRAALLGAATGLAVSLLPTVRLTYSGGDFDGWSGGPRALSIGTGALAPALLGALWFGGGYFLLSYRLGHRVLKPAPAETTPYPYSNPAGYAQPPEQGAPYGYAAPAQEPQAARAASGAPPSSETAS
ncbi:MAG TPA: zinc ribbon domain-containing protein [Actinocrinis sp.]|jgi:hypothetical protein